jgi:hypothetical protein
MLTKRKCAALGPSGQPCQSPPLHDSQFCFMHSPEHAQEAQDARRMGGLRHRKEATISAAYDIEDLNSLDGVRRVLWLVATDTLSLDNSVSRNRTLIYLMVVALKVIEVGAHEERITTLEQAVRGKQIQSKTDVFDIESELVEDSKEAK